MQLEQCQEEPNALLSLGSTVLNTDRGQCEETEKKFCQIPQAYKPTITKLCD